jgi:hypothetical protein
LFYADGRTDGRASDMMKLIAAFRNFANAPKSQNWNNDEIFVAPAERYVLIFTSELKYVSARN